MKTSPAKPRTTAKPAARSPRKPKDTTPAPSEKRPSRRSSFHIVGIGASAGGLEALEQCLGHVPADSGLAFVIVQHLDPTHKGIMPELLQRATPMPVAQVKDRLKVRPNCVYVIPPNKDMALLRGELHLLEPSAPRGLRLPIDFFFRSLAEDLQERSIGIILSGMGTDGTLGLRAIKEKAGVTLVQDPASAKFDSMPRSAIDAGLADVVAPVEDLPGRLLDYLKHVPFAAPPERLLEDKTLSALERVMIVLRARTSHDLSLYKKSTIYRRIERRMGLHQIDRIATYVRFLQENPKEVESLFKELLIGVTSFFRDPPAWEQLKKEGMPSLLAGHQSGEALRAWVPGCSTGEEAYSLAMVFKEALDEVNPPANFALQIFGTDLDREAIDQARQGVFPANITADVSPERLGRFFLKTDEGYRLRKEIREMVVFAPQNVIMDPPFTKLDIITCRNLLIYLAPELQHKLLPLFHYCLNPGGLLLLGSAETVGSFTDLFSTVDSKARLFRRIETPRNEPLDFPAKWTSPPAEPAKILGAPSINLQALAEQLLLQQYTPPAVLVNAQGDILYITGRTGKYLEPAVGKANFNIFAMAREGLGVHLQGAFRKTLQQKGRPNPGVTLKDVWVGTNGGRQAVNVSLRLLEGALEGLVLIIFEDASTPATKPPAPRKPAATRSSRMAALERDLQQAVQEAQLTHEEMQTSQEELKSMNEELQSTNEELQSTNEELTTSKEEMQSLNEELQTVNSELQTKVNELSRANNDMKNLLNSTDIATLFLDGELHVRRFTTQAIQLMRLIPGDVGRPVTDLASDLLYPELSNDAHEVLRTLVYVEKTIATRDGRWFATRIMPYRTLEDRIDGVVITFSDVTEAKLLEEELRKAQAELETQLTASATELAQAKSQLQTEVARRQQAERGQGRDGGESAQG